MIHKIRFSLGVSWCNNCSILDEVKLKAQLFINTTVLILGGLQVTRAGNAIESRLGVSPVSYQ